MKFSVLMSVYNKENPKFFDLSIKSIWDDQKLKPNQVVIVVDGIINKRLEHVIEKWKKLIKSNMDVVRLIKNVGLGKALSHGLNKCKYTYVARMDTDDISHPERFLKQVKYLKNNPDICLLGSNVYEFDENGIYSKKIVPYTHDNICKYIKYRNPFNHMSVIFRKDQIIKIGGYPHFIGYEDYCLWFKVINNKFRTYNLKDCLVSVRGGNQMLKKRSNYFFFNQEIRFQNYLFKNRCISFTEFIRNLILRSVPRLLPLKLLKTIYLIFLRKNES